MSELSDLRAHNFAFKSDKTDISQRNLSRFDAERSHIRLSHSERWGIKEATATGMIKHRH